MADGERQHVSHNRPGGPLCHCCTVLGYFVLSGMLSPRAVVGIAVTLSGVSLVILEKDENAREAPLPAGKKALGVLCGIVGPLGQGVGLVISKYVFMVAVSCAEAGMAATLGSLVPVLIMPVVWVQYRQRTSWRGVLGALVAIAGVAVLMLHGYLQSPSG